VDTLTQYFSCLENILDCYKFRILLLGDLNVPAVDWKFGLPSSSFHYYKKSNDEATYSPLSIHCLPQHNYSSNNGNLLELMLINIIIYKLIIQNEYDINPLVHPNI